MDPFNLIGWLMALTLLFLLLTPVVKIFNFTLRSWIKTSKKTAKIIRS